MIDWSTWGRSATPRSKTLSGGQRRRLDLALGIAGDPELIFLDEPTTGFDPSARRRCVGAGRAARGLGKTVLLTTHYMDEAQHLADRVAVIAHGRIVAEGTPDTPHGRLRRRGGGVLTAGPATSPADLPLPASARPEHHDGRVSFQTETPTRDLAPLIAWAGERGVELDALTVSRPSLEDVYLELTPETEVMNARGPGVDLEPADARSEAVSRIRLTRRTPRAAFFTFVFPLVFLILFEAANGNGTVVVDGNTVNYSQYVTPAIGVFGVATACYTGVIFTVANAREQGVLKRVRSTPLPGWIWIASVLLGAVLMGVASVTLMFAISIPAFGVEIYWHTLPAAIFTIIVGAVSLAAVGLAVAGFVRRADAARRTNPATAAHSQRHRHDDEPESVCR